MKYIYIKPEIHVLALRNDVALMEPSEGTQIRDNVGAKENNFSTFDYDFDEEDESESNSSSKSLWD